VSSVRVARATGGGDPPRWPGFALRTTTATALALVMFAVATPSGGADGPDDARRLSASVELERASTPTAIASARPGQDDAAPRPHVTATPASRSKADLERAREEVETSAAALSEARIELDRAVAVRAEALAVEVAAQDALLAARVRLGDLIAAEDAAVVTLTAAADAVHGAAAGSKAHSSAFISWQMAAVVERAAHARRTIAEEVGARLFEKLRDVGGPLAEAEIALGEAQSAHRKAERTAAAASSRLAELEAATPSAGRPHSTPTPTPPSPSATVARPVRAEP